MTRSGALHFNITFIRIHIRMEKYHVRIVYEKNKHKNICGDVETIIHDTITYHWGYFVRS